MSIHNSDISKEDIQLGEIFRTIRKYQYSIVASVILFTLAATVYAYLTPNVYSTFSTVEISPNEHQGKIGAEDIVAMVMDGKSVNADTEIEIIKSYSLAEMALKNVNITHHYYTTRRFKKVELYKESPFEVGMLKGYGFKFYLTPVSATKYKLVVEDAKDIYGNEWSYEKVHEYGKEIVTEHFHVNILKKGNIEDRTYYFVIDDKEEAIRTAMEKIIVNQKSKKTSMLTISYTDNVPLRAKEFVDSLVQAYMERSIVKKTQEAELRLSFINRQLKHITDNLNSSASRIEEFKRTSNAVDLNEAARKSIKQMTYYETKLEDVSLKAKILDNLYNDIKDENKIESISVADVSSAYSGQTPLTTMIENLQKAITTKKKLSSDFTNVHPEIRRVNKEIISLKSIISSTIGNLRRNSIEKKRSIEKSITKLQKYLNTLPADERAFGELERKFKINSKVYSYLLQKQSETAMVKASTISQINIIDKALLAKRPIKPKRILIILIGFILGLLLGLLLAFLRRYLNNKIQGEDDIKKLTTVPMIGFIPNIQEKKGEKVLKVYSSPRSVVTEAFRNLRTNLQFMSASSSCHMIAVTSTVGGEGKSTVSLNLAAMMSIGGKKTILVNLDMRKPTLHTKLEVLNTKGASSYLSKQLELGEIILETKYEGLDTITSGPIPPNPGELMQGDRMISLLEDLRKMYDVVILDTPPVGLVSDARTLMHYVDVILYVARVNYSKTNFLQYIKKLSKDEVVKMGIVLNDIDIERDGFGLGYGYYEED